MDTVLNALPAAQGPEGGVATRCVVRRGCTARGVLRSGMGWDGDHSVFVLDQNHGRKARPDRGLV
jgi:hypothetical protein